MSTTERWAGKFGSDYTARSPGEVGSNIAFFIHALRRTGSINSVLEFGAGVGSNLSALTTLMPDIHTVGVEVNKDAVKLLQGVVEGVVCDDALHIPPFLEPFDLVLTKGFLIHIAPADLDTMYAQIGINARRYVLLAEYYSPHPQEIEYRGEKGMLWKRDFGGEFLYSQSDFRLIDHGFASRLGRWPQDDLNWWLMERRS